MKERILTAAVALALIRSAYTSRRTPFTIAIYIMATIGLYEILRMKDLHLFSLPGLFTWIVLIVMLMPTNWSNTIYEAIGYTKFELMFAVISDAFDVYGPC